MFDNYDRRLKALARANRKSGNLVEVLLWNQLKSRQLGFTFNRQRPIGNYIVDFLCKELRLIIEIDGNTHDCKLESDSRREAYLVSLGYTVLRFQNNDVLRNMDGVVASLREWIKEAKTRTSP